MPASITSKYPTLIIKFWLPVFLCMGFIFFSSSVPGSDIPLLFSFQDHIFHLITYSILGFLSVRALKNSYPHVAPVKMTILAIVFAFFYGITDELHQAFVPYRNVSGLDLFIDGVGSFLGTILYRWPR